MAKRNRYSGVLQPRMVGSGSPESAVLVLYDIEEDRLRSRVSTVCLDYGLERIQFSAFMGKLNRNQREELILRIKSEVQESLARIRVIPLCQDDCSSTWVLDQYCLPEEAQEATGHPSLRVVAAD